jgi:hypothetical protein
MVHPPVLTIVVAPVGPHAGDASPIEASLIPDVIPASMTLDSPASLNPVSLPASHDDEQPTPDSAMPVSATPLVPASTGGAGASAEPVESKSGPPSVPVDGGPPSPGMLSSVPPQASMAARTPRVTRRQAIVDLMPQSYQVGACGPGRRPDPLVTQ